MKTWIKLLYCFSMYLIITSVVLAGGTGYPGIQLDHVVITGTSNVADFKLVYVNEQQNFQGHIPDTVPSFVIFRIPVDSITASNRLLVSDFKALIDAAQHPTINIEVDRQQIVPIFNGEEMPDIKVRVTLAGISNWYTIPLFTGLVPGGSRYIMGKTSLKLSDFHLEPKSKIFGLIKISNEVFINFRINFSPTELTQIDRF
jgi:hypothetical protein